MARFPRLFLLAVLASQPRTDAASTTCFCYRKDTSDVLTHLQQRLDAEYAGQARETAFHGRRTKRLDASNLAPCRRMAR